MRRAGEGGAPGATGSAPGAPSGGMRLNKLLASRGLGARRKCDALIQAGSVRVNGTVVKEPGTQVMPDRDRVEVHGRPIPGRAALRYLMVNKPVGVITTLDDPQGRPTVRTLLPPGPRMFPVGRLDAETSGLIIVTNDGALAHHLMHPRYGVRKVYRARLDRPPDADQIRRLREGVEFEPGIVSAPCEVRVHSARADRAEIEIVLHEGRFRQVRRMCEAVGLRVEKLHRPTYGPVTLGELPRGAWRELTPDEVQRLRATSARPVARVTARAPHPGQRPAPGSGSTGARFAPRPEPTGARPAPRSKAASARPGPRRSRVGPASRFKSNGPRPGPRRPIGGPAPRFKSKGGRPGPRRANAGPAPRFSSKGGRPAPRPADARRARASAGPGEARTGAGRPRWPGKGPRPSPRQGQSAGRRGPSRPRSDGRDASSRRGSGAGRPKSIARRFGVRRTTY